MRTGLVIAHPKNAGRPFRSELRATTHLSSGEASEWQPALRGMAAAHPALTCGCQARATGRIPPQTPVRGGVTRTSKPARRIQSCPGTPFPYWCHRAPPSELLSYVSISCDLATLVILTGSATDTGSRTGQVIVHAVPRPDAPGPRRCRQAGPTTMTFIEFPPCWHQRAVNGRVRNCSWRR